ncbi:MAG: UbiA family prenyltransferase [Candidatus Aenigmarchaeota archaeon]|nr:UbiA family prenyltransferase [Candidatus Aenigmarchaeota archaeon]
MEINFRDISEFIRLKVCLIISSIAICGFLLFNSLNATLIFIFLSSFFGTAGAYAFNNINDKEEDLINRKRINPFVLNKKGLLIIAVCFIISMIFITLLPTFSIVFSFFGIISSFAYSRLKIKKYSVMKNVFTAIGVGASFLVGTTFFDMDVLWNYLIFMLFIFILSLTSDLRDFEGDKKSNIGTLPVSIGYEKARIFLMILLGIFTLNVLLTFRILVFIPFTVLMFYYLYLDKPKRVHSFGGYSLMFLAISLFVF